jgi:hypothetical protein
MSERSGELQITGQSVPEKAETAEHFLNSWSSILKASILGAAVDKGYSAKRMLKVVELGTVDAQKTLERIIDPALKEAIQNTKLPFPNKPKRLRPYVAYPGSAEKPRYELTEHGENDIKTIEDLFNYWSVFLGDEIGAEFASAGYDIESADKLITLGIIRAERKFEISLSPERQKVLKNTKLPPK